jgi:hypothetical protein
MAGTTIASDITRCVTNAQRAAPEIRRIRDILSAEDASTVRAALVAAAQGPISDPLATAIRHAAADITGRLSSDRHDYPGGRYHRTHPLGGPSELDLRRWPPTGDRDLWILYGPAGPPEVAA